MKKFTKHFAIGAVAGFIASAIVSTILLSITGCSADAGYKYADQFDVGSIASTEAMQYVKKYEKPEVNEGDAKLLESVKGLVKEHVAHPELLDWAKFDQLQTVKGLDLKVGDIDGMSREEIYIYQNYLAFYDAESDSMYILPQFYVASDDQKIYVFIHEVIHSLIDNRDGSDDSRLVEGTVDWLATKVCEETSIASTPAYQESILCLRILMDIYGEDRALQAVCEDRIAALIDDSTQSGMAEKLSYALAISHDDTNSHDVIRDAVYVQLDILAHAAKHEGVDISDWLDATAAIYQASGIQLDISYFKKI